MGKYIDAATAAIKKGVFDKSLLGALTSDEAERYKHHMKANQPEMNILSAVAKTPTAEGTSTDAVRMAIAETKALIAAQKAAPAPAAAAPTELVPAATPSSASSDPWYKRNPEGALLGLAGAGVLGGAGLYGLYHLYVNKKLKEREAQKKGLNPDLLKAAMTAMAAPTAPSAAAPGPKPQMSGAIPSGQPNAPQQASSSTSRPTTSQQPQQTLQPTWRQTASDQVAQGSGVQQQGQEQQSGGQGQG